MFEKSGSINYYLLYKSLEEQEKKEKASHGHYAISKPDPFHMNFAQN